VTCCLSCARKHVEIVEVYGRHFWVDDIAQGCPLVRSGRSARNRALAIPRANGGFFRLFEGSGTPCPPEYPALPPAVPVHASYGVGELRAGRETRLRASPVGLGRCGWIATGSQTGNAGNAGMKAPDWHGGGGEANSPQPNPSASRCDRDYPEGMGDAEAAQSQAQAPSASGASPGAVSTRARKGRTKRGEGLGGERPVPQNKRCLEDAVPGKPKKIGDRGTAVAKVLRSSFLCLEVRTPTGADGSCGPSAEKKRARSPRVARARSPGLAEERKRTKVSLRLPNTPFPV
jgi:hypothetical protein